MDEAAIRPHPEPWNKGKLVGQKAPFKPKEIWAIRVRLQLFRRVRDLALFDLGIDSKLRACDLVRLKVRDICHAMNILRGFGVSIAAGPETKHSAAHQVALLTLINVARRTFLGGVESIGVPNAPLLVPLAPAGTLADAVRHLGGALADTPIGSWPTVLIGSCVSARSPAAWQMTWQGCAAVSFPPAITTVFERMPQARLPPPSPPPQPVRSCFHGTPRITRWRADAARVSLWNPGTSWLTEDAGEPALAWLPSRLWLIGLGNLGQAFAWLLAGLPYADRGQVELVLQDFDRIAESNDSTSLGRQRRPAMRSCGRKPRR